MAIEIVDFPSCKMVDLSIVFCMFTRPGNWGYTYDETETSRCTPTIGMPWDQKTPHVQREWKNCPGVADTFRRLRGKTKSFF